MNDPQSQGPPPSASYPRLLHRYERLLELSSDLVSTLDLDTLLQHIVEAAEELTESEAASLLLYDPQSDHLYFEAATGDLALSLGRTMVPTDGSIAGWVFKEGKPLLVPNVLKDPRFFPEVDVLTRFETSSILGVPLQTKGKILGVIEAVNKRNGLFDEDDLRVLETLAAQAAIAIENTRLFRQSDLVAEMVHELRTPLAALTAAAHLLRRPDLPEEQRANLGETIFQEVQRLNGMASDFLELARLESGRVRFDREPVHLGGLVGECLALIQPHAEAQNITLETQIDPDVPTVVGDRNRLKQIMLNLLTNAIKYNQPGGRVVVRVSRSGDEVLLAVDDTGRGIPAESLPHIFERFYRVPDQEGLSHGTGLGLAIAKRIAESHQGTIEVASEPGKGSTFTLRLPAGPPTPPGTRPVPLHPKR